MTRALLLLPVLVLTTACGGGGAPDGAKAAYVSRAEAVCTAASAEQASATFPASAAELPAYVRRVVTIASDASAELNALEPPPADAARLEEKFLAPLRTQVAKGQAYATQVDKTAAGGDTAAVLALLGTAPLQTSVDTGFLTDYGLPACVKAVDLTRR